jgi:hypothetical protein
MYAILANAKPQEKQETSAESVHVLTEAFCGDESDPRAQSWEGQTHNALSSPGTLPLLTQFHLTRFCAGLLT